MTTFGKRLQELRKEQGISQRDLAEQVGLDFTYLSKMENERLEYPPSIRAIEKLAHALGANTEELLTLAGKRKTPRYTTVLDIIEAGIAGNPERCRAYAELWGEQLANDGETRIVGHLQHILEGGGKGQVLHLAESEGKP